MNKLVRTTNIISILLFKSILNVLKSAFFNIFMMLLGFALGYYALALKVHYYATVNDDYMYIEKLEQSIRVLEDLDDEYTVKERDVLKLLKQFKYKLSHDQHHECDSKVGTVLYK